MGVYSLSAAIKDYETAREHSENDRQIKEGLEKAQRLLKQSQKRDYYKILGVKRCITNRYAGRDWGALLVIAHVEHCIVERNCITSVWPCRRTAQKKEIVKAYRKQAQQWHPDNFQDPVEKKKAEKKFIDIAQAKEVLTDPGKCPMGRAYSPLSSCSLTRCQWRLKQTDV